MNFSGISNKILLGKVLRLPLQFIPKEAQLPILQGKLQGKRWIAGSSTHGCWAGSYEYKKRRLFEHMVVEDSVVFDIGAHVGFYTLLASVLVQERGHVLAFEPLPRNLLYLEEHLRINKVANVSIIKAAVTDTSGQAYFDDTSGNSMGRVVTQGKIQVPTVSLDKFVIEYDTPLPDFIKIDVEGAENLVLTGAKRILADARPTLFLATHGLEIHRWCCEFLIAMGYQLSPITGDNVETTDEILAQFK
jgi:FkbM family methyltransferase